MKKTIAVLANSVKRSGRCLAGKEMVWDGRAWKAGQWIRPVSTTQGGEVSVAQMVSALGREPSLLELVEMPIDSAVPLPDQPENWLIEPSLPWRRVGTLDWLQAAALVDRPRQVWDEGQGWRRVTQGYVPRMSQPASLYLIKPEEIVNIEVWTGPNPFEPPPSVKRHRQAMIRYGGLVHEFDITDPSFADRYYPNFPAVGTGRRKIALRAPSETLVCVSVTPEYKGHQYKLVAAFIEPPLKR
ncbi:MAG: hypothetical protein FJ395_18550 [Verrucomicrobia bacterium]|nr:hypothetical protein [Verrucomicrobiota bacterium]